MFSLKIGLVLEGGGMRGLFTAGVLDYLMDIKAQPDYCIGVSAGACNGVSFVSGQRGRNKRINIEYAGDKRYVSVQNLFRQKSMFGMDFIFNDIPNKLDLFDYDAFAASPIAFVTGVSDVETGKPAYFSKEAIRHDSTVLRASSSIPVFSPIVTFRGGKYLDGGTTDPIPVRKALEDGCDKVIVVLTRDRNYVKSPEKMRSIYRHILKDYPNMIAALDHRHEVYNDTLAYLRELERNGTALVIAPAQEVTLGRFDNSREKLEALYEQGYQQAKLHDAALKKFLSREQAATENGKEDFV